MNASKRLDISRYTISPELQQQGYAEGNGPCKCSSRCCHHGVFADVKERDKILAHKEVIKKYMDETQNLDENRWFDTTEEIDADFISGLCVGTQVINDKCAFLDKVGYCSLQVTAAQLGMHKWELKPTFCILFPLTIVDNVIVFDDLLNEEQNCCTITPDFKTSLAEACKEELVYIFGEDGYDLARTPSETTIESRSKLAVRDIA